MGQTGLFSMETFIKLGIKNFINMGTVTITRKKTGFVQTFEDGKLVKEIDPSKPVGQQGVHRVILEAPEEGTGRVRSRRVTTQKDLAISQQVQQAQATISKELKGTEFEARASFNPATQTIVAQPTVSRTKELSRERLLNISSQQRERPVMQVRSLEEAEQERTRRQQEQAELTAKQFSTRKFIEKEQPDAFKAGADPRLILGGEKDTLKSAGFFVGGTIAAGTGIALAPMSAGASTVLVGVGGGLISKGVARGQEGLFGTTLSPKEKELITQPQFVEAFGSSILQSQEQFRERNPIINRPEETGHGGLIDVSAAGKRVAGSLNLGISASTKDFQTNLERQLTQRGFSPQEVELGLELGQKRRTVGVKSDVIEVIGAGVSVEKAGRLALSGAKKSLGTKIATTGFLGAVEAPLLTSGQARASGLEVSLSQLGLSSALGAASAGTVTGVIGRAGIAGKVVGGKTGRRVSESVAEKGFFTIDPSEAIVDLTTGLAEKSVRKERISIRPVTLDGGGVPKSFKQNINIPQGTQRFEGFKAEPVITKKPRSARVATTAAPFDALAVPTTQQQNNLLIDTKPKDTPKKTRTTPDTFSSVLSQPSTRTLTSSQAFTNIQAFTSARPSTFVNPRTQVSTISEGGFLTLPPRRGGATTRKGDGGKTKRDKQYVASLAAVGLNITGEESSGSELTGFGLRPLKRRKKTRKKKK